MLCILNNEGKLGPKFLSVSFSHALNSVALVLQAFGTLQTLLTHNHRLKQRDSLP